MVVTSQVMGRDEMGTERDISKLAKSHHLIHGRPAPRLGHIISPL